MSQIIPELAGQQRAMCRLLRKRIRSFYADKQNRQEFEAWYEATYGKKYGWKKVEDWFTAQNAGGRGTA